MHEIGQPINFY